MSAFARFAAKHIVCSDDNICNLLHRSLQEEGIVLLPLKIDSNYVPIASVQIAILYTNTHTYILPHKAKCLYIVYVMCLYTVYS